MIEQRKKLAILWFSVTGLFFLVLLIMSITDRLNGSEIAHAWTKFFGPLALPLGMIISTFVKDEKAGVKSKPAASPFLFRMTYILSFICVSLPLLFLLYFPFVDPENPIAYINSRWVIIAAVETLPFTAMGFFFYGNWVKK
ncbi:hypothetical protein [Glaciecola petra]|uniref:Uncharacterized protein n=1 Tax=Glaciecola petra TaxID=3075602 RepID=A0ABU2ZPH0_9ALTE|nr:hypothetical protein [Aestuariibacter sp. P117]MDT0594525.1 hypothetical protein [Aestuariibacter sp. P117]